jgi:hypothetical protein
MTGLRRGPRLLALLTMLMMSGGAAGAHSGNTLAGPDSGVKIPGVTHGQMAVIDRFSGQIADLAKRQFAPDQDFSRILNYARIQQTYCAWGLMPAAVSDETSPFNECSHAYLAAIQDILLRMGTMPRSDPRVASLIYAVDRAMLEDGTGLLLCAYSDATFNTALILKPDWRAVPSHWPSLAALLAVALAGAALMAVALRYLRTPPLVHQPK